MRRVLFGIQLSLDGVVEAPDTWHFPYFNDEMGEAVGESMGAADAMLLGRVTWQEFAAYWPNSTDDQALAAQMNNTPKYVVSSTLQNADDWQNSTLINGNVAEELTKLKQQEGKNLGITGSATLIRSLLELGLLDELQLLQHPIVVGRGKRLFPDGTAQQGLKLVDSKTFSTGVVSLMYQPATD